MWLDEGFNAIAVRRSGIGVLGDPAAEQFTSVLTADSPFGLTDERILIGLVVLLEIVIPALFLGWAFFMIGKLIWFKWKTDREIEELRELHVRDPKAAVAKLKKKWGLE